MSEVNLDLPETPQPSEKKEKSLEIIFGWETQPNLKHPGKNEDSLLLLPEKGFFAVFDGVGGSSHGEAAAALAKKTIKDYLSSQIDPNSPKEVQNQLGTALVLAHQKIKKTLEDGLTTAVIAHLWENPQNPKEKKLIVANVGDSRAYLLRDGEIEQITVDHGPVFDIAENEEEARRLQEKISQCPNPEELPEKERALFRQRKFIYQSLGEKRENISPSLYTLTIEPGDQLLFCSDGVSDNLTDKEIEEIIFGAANSQEAAKTLVREAQKRSQSPHPRAKKDDMTAIVVTLPAESKPPAMPEQNKTPEIKIGSPVVVQRSAGSIEKGWEIESIDQQKGRATVTKEIPGEEKFLRKQIDLETLIFLNKPAEPADIKEAKNLGQLYYKLGQLGQLEGSRETFTSADLIYLIEEVRSGRNTFNAITRTANLRETVERLLKKGR